MLKLRMSFFLAVLSGAALLTGHALSTFFPGSLNLLLDTLCLLWNFGLSLAVFAGVVVGGTRDIANGYFVSPDGDDRNAGTRQAPWRTVEHAFAQLGPGDTLNLRSGSYFEPGLRLTARGTSEQPIIIRTDPSDLESGMDRAVIDGAAADYQKAPNELWEPVPDFNADTPVYRTRETFPEATWLNAWLLRQEVPCATVPRDIQLMPYSFKANIESTNYTPTWEEGEELPLYVGPGVHLGEDDRIYIRLTINPLDALTRDGKPIAEPPYANTDFNPNHYRIAIAAVKEDRPRTKGEIYSYTPGLVTLDGAAHIGIRNLTFRHANAVMRWDGSEGGEQTHHIEVTRCKFVHGESGILAYGARDCRIAHSEFDNALPDWLHWRDVKGSPPIWKEAFPVFQSFAINGVLSGFTIANNLIHNSMDGLMLRNRTVGATVTHNIIRNLHDDAINLDPNVKDVEIAWNVLRHCHAGMSLILPYGISSTTDEVIPETKGPVHIHHNVIDLSQYHRWSREPGGSLWSTGAHFASHGHAPVAVPWRIYNNTIVGLKPDPRHRSRPLGLGSRQLQTPEVFLYNNLFYSIGDRSLLSGANKETGAHYDGNVFRRSASATEPLLHDFGDGGTYRTLKEFLTAQEKSGDAAPWETSAIEIVDDDPRDPRPLFDETAILAPDYEPEQLAELYRPKNHHEVFTPGARIPADWPGASEGNYRGAVGPGAMPPIGPQ